MMSVLGNDYEALMFSF